MLVRTSARDREAGIRIALGAGRAALFRLVLSEALVLIVLGGIAGSQLPLRGESFIDTLQDQPAEAQWRPYTANYRFASADYWRALGVPLRQGRYIEERDYDRNVVVVSDKVVALLWPGENPLGKHLRMLTLVRNPGGFEPQRLPGGGTDFRAMEVVGVVADTR